MQYFPQHVLLCTSTVHDQSANICIRGYLGILWKRNTKSSKLDGIHKCYVSCLKLEYFFKSCKLTREWIWNSTSGRETALLILKSSILCRVNLGLPRLAVCVTLHISCRWCIFDLRKSAILHFWPTPNPQYYTSDLLARGFAAARWTCGCSSAQNLS